MGGGNFLLFCRQEASWTLPTSWTVVALSRNSLEPSRVAQASILMSANYDARSRGTGFVRRAFPRPPREAIAVGWLGRYQRPLPVMKEYDELLTAEVAR